jgi:hypothetical protein
VFLSLAIIFRGLAVNLFLVFGVIVFLAALTILANPTTEDLKTGLFANIFGGVITPTSGTSDTWIVGFLKGRFGLTWAVTAIMTIYLIFWAAKESCGRLFSRKDVGEREVAVYSAFTRIGSGMILLWISCFAIDLNGVVLRGIIHVILMKSADISSMLKYLTVAAGYVSSAMVFRGKLMSAVKGGAGDSSLSEMIKSILAGAMLLIAALILPICIYVAYTLLVYYGIGIPHCPLALLSLQSCIVVPPFFGQLAKTVFSNSATNIVLISEAILCGICLCFNVACKEIERNQVWISAAVLFIAYTANVLALSEGDVHRELLFLVAFVTVFLAIIQAVRVFFGAGRGIYILAFLIFCAFALQFWAMAGRGTLAIAPVVKLHANAAFVVLIVSITFSANANSLHGLYRDRLRDAFLKAGVVKSATGEADKSEDDSVGREPQKAQPESSVLGLREGQFTALNAANAPYIIMNCALNARRSASTDGRENHAAADPVKRGRHAEFFFFSPKYTGSDATGYIKSHKLSERAYDIDIAAATAISGAAISSNMGKVKFTTLSLTLALLNLRLGYWMKNPLHELHEQIPVKWYHWGKLYLLAEMFGLLSTDSPQIYLTDGGHIENLGIYQLLKRRCPIIIVADAEADPKYTFESLSDLERYARIDLGVRIDMDWKHIRDFALATAAGGDIPKTVDPKFCHFAVGKIYYPGIWDAAGHPVQTEVEGILLYVKASVTGDEPDYVLDYNRRYSAFPHETTLDQFFSEDQMEAYRALGFHALDRALDDRNLSEPHQVPRHDLISDLKQRLGAPVRWL